MRPGLNSLRPLILVVLLSAVSAVPAAAQSLTSPADGARLRAGDDFATVAFGDPWDMSNVEDVAAYPPGLQNWQSVAGIGGGVWSGVTGTDDAFMTLLHQGQYPGVNYDLGTLHLGRWGINTPIAASVWRKISMKFRTDTAGQIVGIHWFKSLDQNVDSGGRFLHWGPTTVAGRQVVTADLASVNGAMPQFGSTWSGNVLGVRIDPNDGAGGVGMLFELDWVRLTRGDGDPAAVRHRVTWSGGTGSTKVEVVDAAGDVVETIATGASGDQDWFYGHLPPGAYTIRLRNGGATVASNAFAINHPPIVHVVDPDETGGDDWATTVKGNPWDMSGPSDVMQTVNVTGPVYTTDEGQTVYRATSAASAQWTGDPSVFLVTKDTPAVDAARYHRFSFRMKVSYPSPADWVTTRVLWGKDAINSSLLTHSQDILVWNNEYRTFSVDLATLTEGPGVEPGYTAGGLWNGTVRWLRFDPLEYPEATLFQIDHVKLAADDETKGGVFFVRWNVSDADAGDAPAVALYYDTDTNPASGLTLIAAGIPASQGVYRWNASKVPPGVYHVYAVATDGVDTLARYSTGPVRVLAPAVPAPAVLSDFSGDGRANLAVYRPTQGAFLINGQAPRAIGAAGDVPVPGDYDGDLDADAATWSPVTGTWAIEGQSPFAWGQAGDVPVPADYDGDGRVDPAVFRPSTGQWLVRNVGTFAFGMAGDVPVPADYDGDGRADIAVFRRSTGQWIVRNGATTSWGIASDLPVPADYDGDGRADLAVYRPSQSTWFVRNLVTRAQGAVGDLPLAVDLNGDGRAELVTYRRETGVWTAFDLASGVTSSSQYGAPGDIPASRRPQLPLDAMGDFDGDFKADPTVYRPGNGTWYTLFAASGWGAASSLKFGASTDEAVAGDYRGLGRSQQAVFRAGTWYIHGGPTLSWGASGDVPVAGDYDGDGRTDAAVFRPASGAWYILRSSTAFTGSTQVSWGMNGDVPVPADYDGDGRADAAVYRPASGTWYIRPSGGGAPIALQWGASSDRPVPADYDGDGRADLAVFRPSNGTWYIRYAAGNFASSTTVQWGASGDEVAAADYDGDGKADLAVFRPAAGTWFVRGIATLAWGAGGDRQAVRR